MKAAANGVLNISTSDGWWDEVWRDFGTSPEFIGWTVGRGEIYSDDRYQDQVESDALYDLLEREVIPTFYDRRDKGQSRRWITYMKRSIGSLCHFYNAHRMTREYAERLYLPAHRRFRELTTDDLTRARALSAWKNRVREAWSQIKVEMMDTDPQAKADFAVGDEVRTRTRIRLGGLSPDDVSVQLYLGRLNADCDIVEAEAVPMHLIESDGKGTHIYESRGAVCKKSGLHGYTIRVLPNHPDLATPFLPGLITWAGYGESPKRS
jgi:starch phosphorylase